MQTVGRNDPCPCGSGRKFKHCCERDGVPRGGSWDQPESESDWLAALKAQLRRQDFDNIEELRTAAEEVLYGSNRAPQEDFHGLSPDQMYDVLHFPFDSPRIVTFSDRLTMVPKTPFSKILFLLIHRIDEERPKATKIGNLPRSISLEIANAFRNSETFTYKEYLGEMRREKHFPDLHHVRRLCEITGLIRKYRGRFLISKKCRDIMSGGGLLALTPFLLREYVQTFNWAYRDGFPDLPFVQQSFLFSLFLLSKYGSEWRSHEFYQDQFLNAFPHVTDLVANDRYVSPEKTVRSVYTNRIICNFLGFFGLADVEPVKGGTYFDSYRVRATPLLGDTVAFHD